jgi:hypothetical protein
LIVHDQPISVSVPPTDGPNANGWPIRDHLDLPLCPLTEHQRYEPRAGRCEAGSNGRRLSHSLAGPMS